MNHDYKIKKKPSPNLKNQTEYWNHGLAKNDNSSSSSEISLIEYVESFSDLGCNKINVQYHYKMVHTPTIQAFYKTYKCTNMYFTLITASNVLLKIELCNMVATFFSSVDPGGS